MEQFFWPYEEIQIHPVNETQIVLKTPWFMRTLEIAEDQHILLQKIISAPDQYSFLEQRDFWTNFFAPLHMDPILYRLPRPLSQLQGLDQHRCGSVSDLERSIASFLTQHQSGLSEKILSLGVKRDWDKEALIQFAKIPDAEAYDPISLFTVLRRFYYLDAIEFDQTAAMYAFMDQLQEDERRFSVGSYLIAYQNYEVTRRCQEILAPALDIAQTSQEDLRHFIQAEHGHDKLLYKALSEFDRESLGSVERVLPMTTLLLDLFKYNAQKNYLSFAFTVSLFEESSPTGKDPLTEMLKKGQAQEAANYFDIHYGINDQGEHHNIGTHLLTHMGPVTHEYALEAAHLCEAISKVLNLYTTNIFEVIQNI